MAEIINVNYACDGDGDYTAPISLCCDNQSKSFEIKAEEDYQEIRNFIDKCTYVHNLEDILPKICHKKSNESIKV